MQTGTIVLGGADIHDARQTPAVLRGKPAGMHIDASDGRIDERAEEASKVKRVVDRIAVEKDQILIGLAAPHVHPRRVVIARFDPRH